MEECGLRPWVASGNQHTVVEGSVTQSDVHS